MFFLCNFWKWIKVGTLNRYLALVKLLIVVISTLCLFQEAQAEPLVEVAKELVVVIPAKYPPYYVINEDNQLDGFAINVFEEIASRAGLRFRYDIKPNWTAVCNALKDGSADIIPLLGRIIDREEYALFTSAVETFPVSIFVRNSNLEINTLKDLEKHTIATVSVECQNQFITDRDQNLVKKFNQFDTAFQSLLSRQVDAMVYPQTVMLNIVNDYDWSLCVRLRRSIL